MNRIVKILMNRDGMSREEAEDLYNNTLEEVLDSAEDDISYSEEIFSNNLGLELDYLPDLLLGLSSGIDLD